MCVSCTSSRNLSHTCRGCHSKGQRETLLASRDLSLPSDLHADAIELQGTQGGYKVLHWRGFLIDPPSPQEGGSSKSLPIPVDPSLRSYFLHFVATMMQELIYISKSSTQPHTNRSSVKYMKSDIERCCRTLQSNGYSAILQGKLLNRILFHRLCLEAAFL